MNLVKTSLLNGLAVITKVATALALNKVLAIYVGPAGYAVIGQFQSLLAMVFTFASGGVNTGVTKYTAEFHAAPQKQQDSDFNQLAVRVRVYGAVGDLSQVFGGLDVGRHAVLGCHCLAGSCAYTDASQWIATGNSQWPQRDQNLRHRQYCGQSGDCSDRRVTGF